VDIIDSKLNWGGALAKRSKIDMIVLHHAAATNCTVYNVHQWHLANGWSGCGYHYFIKKDGRIFKGRPDDTIGSHVKGYNSASLGICFEGDFDKEIPTQAQIDAGIKLVDHLKTKYNIKNIKSHGQLMQTTCPGKLFPMEYFIGKTENLILSFQRAAVADGIKLKQYGCDGKYGTETANAMKQCVVKRRLFYKYKNATSLVQRLLNVKQDGLCGSVTARAIKEFQQQKKLIVDGAVGEQTWKALLGIE
jgi:N-acetyl-anhydromuramyl-L-alanine amidase AmpD